MTVVSLGDLAHSFMLRRQNVTLKQDMQRLSTELATGRVADSSARLAGDLGPLYGIDASLARLKGYAAVTAEAGLFAATMQTSLGVIDDMSSDLSGSLLSAASAGNTTNQIDLVGGEARQKLESALSALNTRVGDRSLFAGTHTTSPAVVDAETLLSALGGLLAGATSAADVETAVSNWFAAPAGFASLGYQGGPQLAALSVAPGDDAKLDVTANDPTIRATLKGLAMAALLDRGVLAGQPEGRQDLARRAGLSLLESQTDRATLASRLGMAEAQIDAAQARNANESFALQIARNDLVSADPYETASKLQETEAQLEMIYTITARMTRLSLLDYMR